MSAIIPSSSAGDAPPGLHHTSLADLESIDKAIQMVDEAIRASALLYERRRTLYGMHNSHLPVSRLPPEILTEIFRIVVLGQSADSDWDVRRPRPRPYLVLSQICQHWRSLAHRDPYLWATPDFHRPKLAQVMLKLAQDVPLTVYLSSDRHLVAVLGDGIGDPRDATARWFEKIKDLWIFAGYNPVIIRLLARFNCPMPALETLQLQSSERGHASIVFTRSKLLESGEFPHLRDVILINVVLPWDANCLKNLTSLTIDTSSHPEFFDHIMAVLRQNLGLQYLKLVKILPIDDERLSETLPLTKPVFLPHLQRLILHDDTYMLSLLFPSLTLPKLCYLELNGWIGDFSDPNEAAADVGFSAFSYRLGEFLTRMGVSTIAIEAAFNCTPASLHAADIVDYRLVIICSCQRRRRAADHDEPAETFECRLELSGMSRIETPESMDLLSGFLHCFPSEKLSSLTVTYNIQRCNVAIWHFSLPQLWGELALMPSLASITLSGCQSLGIPLSLLTYLSPPAQHDDSQNDLQTVRLFPSLHTLYYETGPIHPVYRNAERCIFAIASVSRERHKAGLQPVLAIEMHQSFIGKMVCVRACGDDVRCEEETLHSHTTREAWPTLRAELLKRTRTWSSPF